MASETRIWMRPGLPTEAWPPHDTEESILGTDLHQTTITNLRLGINEVARLGLALGCPVPWQALSQMALLGCVRRDGSPYRTYPDVFVYRHLIEPSRGSVTLAADGPPVLIVEVLSDSTYEADLDLEYGRGYSYSHAGVREYLAIDPTGDFLPERGRGWRLVQGRYHPWPPDATGRWQSEKISVAIGVDGVLATVYTREGKRLPHEGEYSVELERRDVEIARQAAELDRLRRLLDERQRER